MKIIYSTDDCGYPLCIKINDLVLKRVKEIQNQILKLSIKNNEGMHCTKTIPELFKISEHVKQGVKPYLEINSNNVSICLPGYESCELLTDYENLLELPDIWFSSQFIHYFKTKSNKEFKRCIKKIPKEHLKILNKK
jgi:hypothetical protein